MSTKTTFKRIALVAVASLGFGMLSAAPSQAAGMLADTLVNAADGSATVASTAVVGSGTAATAKIVYSAVATGASDTATVTATITSVPATSGVFATTFAATGGLSPDSTAPALAFSGTTTALLTASAGGRVTKYITASFTPDVAGTYVIAIKGAGGSNNQTVTWTITATGVPAATAAASTVAMYSKALNGGSGTPGTTPNIKNDYEYLRYTTNATLDVALETLVAAGPASGVFSEPIVAANAGDVVGSGIVHLSNKTILAANSAVAVPLTVSISGRGYVSIGVGSTTFGTTVTETSAVGYTPFSDPGNYGRIKYFTVKSDGTTGPATITVSALGVVLGTIDMVFTGAKASLALATGTSTKLSKNYLGYGETATVTINGLDASGNILSASGISAVTDTDVSGTIATAAISGNVVTVTGGLVSGAVTWTVTDGTRTVTFVTNTTKKTAETVTIAMSPISPKPGELVTVTITATDVNGSPVANGSRQLFGTGLIANLQVNASTMTTDGLVSLVDGKKTYTFYAPSTPGTLLVSAKEGSAVNYFVTNGVGRTVSGTLEVYDAAKAATEAAAVLAAAVAAKSDAAIAALKAELLAAVEASQDAAAEAIDAGNNAYDSSNAATDAADAATAAAQQAGEDAVAAAEAAGAAAVAAAQSAQDAAAEATDAATAATDAANAAAEAADAATAAAQDAADAVAALGVAVTAMISDLKKQITALTNLIIKIQKKVKA